MCPIHIIILISVIVQRVTVYAKSFQDYDIISPVGVGGQGSVWLVKDRSVRDSNDQQHFAMKRMLKSHIHQHSQYANVKTERDILTGNRSPWLGRAYHAFQDDKYLILVMEYAPGGDIMTLLTEYDILPEEAVRFYVAEIICALEVLHGKGYVHRDLKPDNILLDISGHVKLTDFGMSISTLNTAMDKTYFEEILDSFQYKYLRRSSEKGTKNTKRPTFRHKRSQTSIPRLESDTIKKYHKKRRFYSMVGTLDYIAPEILTKQGYSVLCDSWSLGIIVYEMLHGYTPFASNTQEETVNKVLNWKSTLEFDTGRISSTAIDFMQKILCSDNHRLSIQQMKDHPFLANVDWESLRDRAAPYPPTLSSIQDTRYFPVEDLQDLDIHYSSFPNYYANEEFDRFFTEYNYETMHRL